MPISKENRKQWSPERLAFQQRARAESEAASAKAKEKTVRDRAAHEALAARDKASAAVRLGEQKLERDRAELDAADREFDRAFPGSTCICGRCDAERTQRLRAGRG